MDARERLVWGAAAIGGAALLVSSWMLAPPRFKLVGAGNGVAYRIDRETGRVAFCNFHQCQPVTENPEPLLGAASAGGDDGDPNTSWAEEYAARQRAREAQGNTN